MRDDQRRRGGVAFLFATHDPRVVARARRIVTLARRRAIESDARAHERLRPGLAQPRPPEAAQLPDDRRRGVRLRGLRAGGRLHRAVLRGAQGGHDPQRRRSCRSWTGAPSARRRRRRSSSACPTRARARAIAAGDPDVAAVLPRIDFVGLATNGRQVGAVPRRRRGPGARGGGDARAASSSSRASTSRATAATASCSGPGLAAALDVEAGRPHHAHGHDARRLVERASTASSRAWPTCRSRSSTTATSPPAIGLVSRLLQSAETVSKLVVFLKPDADESEAADARSARRSSRRVPDRRAALARARRLLRAGASCSTSASSDSSARCSS